jgi:large-conductance mechanosensitive channel
LGADAECSPNSRTFIAKGNVLDLASPSSSAAFATITTSLTGDIIMRSSAHLRRPRFRQSFRPARTDPRDFQRRSGELLQRLKERASRARFVGQFVTVVINFLILAFVHSS